MENRRVTNDLISAIEDGFLTWEEVCREALKYMSEDDVRDMVNGNDWAIADDEEVEDLDEEEYHVKVVLGVDSECSEEKAYKALLKLEHHLEYIVQDDNSIYWNCHVRRDWDDIIITFETNNRDISISFDEYSDEGVYVKELEIH